MDSRIISYVLQDAGILIEAALVLYVACSSQWKRQAAAAFYLTCLLAAQLTRACVLHAYGFASLRYYYVYWSTDFLLVLSAYLAMCLLFRRAGFREEKNWRLIRLLLVLVFVLVAALSGVSLSLNRNELFTYFIIAFNQNLYFACLALNTLLYVLLQYIDSTDDQLALLVCGVGIQFAGPTATLALLHLTAGERFARSLISSVMPLCTLGMLVVWAYAIIHATDEATQVTRRVAEVTAELNV
jgi:hypothetical protein